MHNIHGLGIHSMWGFTTAKHLLTLSEEKAKQKQDEPIHILLLNPSDPRHILKTISENQCDNRPLHFYILERPIEVTARQLLLLYIFMDLEIPIRNRAALFLEVYGNCLIKERTGDYIERIGKCLTEMLYAEEGEEGYFDFSMLKFKERDALERVFKSWRKSVAFDVIKYRDYRLRGHFGDRYDCRKNLIDWDYFSKIKNSASIIHIQQYRDWRMNGIAFEFGKNATSYYQTPNRSFASNHKGRVKEGRDVGLTKQVQGYWCDVVVGPYIPFGVELCCCSRNSATNRKDDELMLVNDLLRVENKGTGMEQHRHNSGEVSMFNVISLMWEFENGKAYKMKTKGDIFSGLCSEDIDSYDENSKDTKSVSTIDKKINKNKNSLPKIKNIKVIPIGEDIKLIQKKNMYKNKFDIIHMSLQAMASMSDTETSKEKINDIVAKDAVIFMETTRYAFPFHSSSSSLKKKQNEKEKDSILMDDNNNSSIPTFMRDIAKENDWKEVAISSSSLLEEKNWNSDTLIFRSCQK